ncbi:ABC transporter substrate-binding protein [Roseivivax sp. THAF197b]|uniref:ABC transporter substrate-binding protein n=1 Tax=Roseivivax sp. THAF197b TaxID=2588299 RepID=UPI001267860F|nr:ABC transporter substrate-binding protein [Roseivivax sp. THAF197b]QFS85044.1 hypothetical protein FIV09_19535 [Roseivivax sp. THAF197b]
MKHTTLTFSAAVLAAGLTAQSAQAQDQIDVGLLLPYSGVYAALGNDIQAGFELGLAAYGDEVEQTFNLHIEDTEVKPPVGLAKARKLVLQDDVDVMVGIVSSAVLGAVSDIVAQMEVPLIVANAGNDDATGAGCSPYITRLSFANGQINRPMGEWMAGQGIETVYTLAPDYAAGRQMIEAFTAGFTEAGGEVVGSQYTPFQQTTDFGPYLTEAKSSGADAVYVFYAGGEAISFVKQYDSFGLKAEMPLYGAGFLTSPLYVNAEGPAAVGVIAALHYVPTIENAENDAFVTAFQEKTGRQPSEFAVHGYDSARAIIEAVKTGATTRSEIAAALSKVSFDGPRGALSIDPATNNIIQPIYVYETVEAEGGEGLTQRIIAQLDAEQMPPNGCEMKPIN